MSEHIYEDSDMKHEGYHVIPFGSMREEIVRCKDCVWAPEREPGEYYHCNMWNADVGQNGFCSRGIRLRKEMDE
jgi:hypothetical protein